MQSMENYADEFRFEKILTAIHNREHDLARSLIERARQDVHISQMHRLTALSAILEIHLGNLAAGIELMRKASREEPTWIPHWYRLGTCLMDGQQWHEAMEPLERVISLSARGGDAYFLDDARLRKAFCLRVLGRGTEIKPLILHVAPDTEVFIDGRLITRDEFE
jgi:tetratricopeptide (TPR) repeat protein